MKSINPGTLCLIIAGCPENIGSIVEVVKHLGPYGDRRDAYLIKTISGRKFNQLWIEGALLKGNSCRAVTDRHKLRPISDDNQNSELVEEVLLKIA